MKTTTFLILRKLSILVILFLIFTAMLTAQVRIKESVEIGPKASSTISKALASSRTHTIGINASWNGANTASLSIWNACDYSIKYSVGPSASPINWTMEGLKPGTYPIDFNIHWEEGGITTVSTMTIFVDGVMQSTQTLENFVDAIIPGYTDYTIGFDTGDMGYEGMSWTWSRLRNYCGEEEFFPSSTVLTMTISEGAEFASLYSYDTQSRLGPSYSGTLNDLNNVVIAADGILPPVGGARVVVEVSGFGETKIVPMTVYPSSLIVKAQPSQISMYGSSGISIRPYPSWGRKAMVYIDSGASYGTLYRSYFDNDKEVYIFGDTLYDVNIGSGVGFSANEQEPDSAVEVHITAKRTYYSGGSINENTNDFPVTGKDTISGSTTIIVKPSRLVVTATPAKIMQGDTSWLEVKQKLPDGTIADLGPLYWSAFEILNTDTVGMLSTMDGTWQDLLVYDTQPYAMFIADRDSTLPDSVDVRIKAEICDDYDVAIGMGKVVMKKNDLDHFKVEIIPDTAATADTVAFTEGAKLIIQAKDKDDNDIVIDANTLLKISLLTNDGYGTFINANSDTLKTTPVQLLDVRYSDAKARRIKFTATKKNPDTFVTCKIRVEKQDDPTKKGERDAVVVEQTLKIVMEAPYQVLPAKLLGRSNQPITEENRKQFIVQHTRKNITAPSQSFNLTTNYVDNTGGHNHLTRRPSDTQTRKRENYGYFMLVRTAANVDRPYLGLTQSDGKEGFQFAASMFGDNMRIIVESTDPRKNKLLRDSATIDERVLGLHLLDEGAGYDLVGGTCNHHGPSDRGISLNCQTPNNNHYATAEVIINIQNIASSYHQQFPNEQVLKINDMSLEYGGRFDRDAQWEGYSNHQYHRQGTDIDIRSSSIPDDDRYRDVNRNGRYDVGEPITFDLNANGQYDYTNTAFERICRRNNVRRPALEYPGQANEHYHLYFVEYNR